MCLTLYVLHNRDVTQIEVDFVDCIIGTFHIKDRLLMHYLLLIIHATFVKTMCIHYSK